MDVGALGFFKDLIGTIGAVGLLVIVAAFLSIPATLNGHPGDPRINDMEVQAHLT